MKKNLITFISGIVVGGISSYCSLVVATKIINKKFSDDENKENENAEKVIDCFKEFINGTDFKDKVDDYLQIIDNTRKLFPNDGNSIINHISNILNSTDIDDTKILLIDDFISNLNNISSVINTTKEEDVNEDTEVSENITTEAVTE